VCGFDRENSNESIPIYNDIEKIKEKVDVIIDFSVPVATFEILKYAIKNKTPIVIATTGFNKEQLAQIEEYSKEIPVFRSANMSLDINLMASIIQKVADVLTDSDIEIIETHHNRKVDSPSGTAILLADAINEILEDKKQYTFDRMQKREKRSKNEIGFSSVRGGNIVGEHTVAFFGENETLEITHKAYSRQVFAEGALKAAMFLIGKENGLYNMRDMV
jgi:4-hydroxy-tetrahydrodipicolinate reductase